MAMIIIAESGSTKIDWRIVSSDTSQHSFNTEGFNPNYHARSLLTDFVDELNEKIQITEAERVYFYGSGCSSYHSKEIVRSAINQVITGAIVEVNHDLTGAARALFGQGTGIASILGTGSSSCIFREGEVAYAIPSLGYLLADEGSGLQLGRLLLNAYFKNQLPSDLSAKFQDQFNIGLSTFITQLYTHPKPNSLIASFVPFLVDHKHEPVIKTLVRKAFGDFFNEIILKYPDYNQYNLGFVGSIAMLFKDLLYDTASGYNLKVARIIQNPVDELVKFHLDILSRTKNDI